MSGGPADLSAREVAELRDATKCSDCRFDQKCCACTCLVPRSLMMGVDDGGGGRKCKYFYRCRTAWCMVCADDLDQDWFFCDTCGDIVCLDCSRACEDCFGVTLCAGCASTNFRTYADRFVCEACFDAAYADGDFELCDRCQEACMSTSNTQYCISCELFICPSCTGWLDFTTTCSRCGGSMCNTCASQSSWVCGHLACHIVACAKCRSRHQLTTSRATGQLLLCVDCRKTCCNACEAQLSALMKVRGDGLMRCIRCDAARPTWRLPAAHWQ